MTQESMEEKTIVITGATSGIGRALALGLGRAGTNLVLVGRNERVGQRLVRQIRSHSSASRAGFFCADLSNLKDVRSLASELKERYKRVEILINNAGARFNHFEETSDGIERTFATNHLGHFLLTTLLFDHLLEARAARIITVGSGAHFGVSGTPSWSLTRATYDRKIAYGLSKLANIIFAYELARRLTGTSVTSNAVDPGGVATNLGRNNGWIPWLRHLAFYALKGQLITARQAAGHIVFLALAEELKGVTGHYFFERKPVMSSRLSQDIAIARELWSMSVKLTGIDASLGKSWEYVQPQDGP